jgi:hypothetical protein
MSKTPFEIRLNLLNLARDLATQDFYIKKDMLMEQWHRNSEVDKLLPVPVLGAYPTEEEIIAKAKLLNAFVSNE